MNNNQIIAVWGNPSSGKTTLSVKIARELSLGKKNVILVICDTLCPSLMVVLPNTNTENKSLGYLISASEITQEQILEKCITLDKNKYVSLLGYSQGENIFSYAQYSKDRAVDFLILLRHIADYVIVDCSSVFAYDTLSTIALEMADSVVRLCGSNLKAVSYFNSYLPLLADRKFNVDRHIKVISKFIDNEPREQIKEIYKGVKYELPYIEEIENQFLTGRLFSELKSKNGIEYTKTVVSLIGTALGENPEIKQKKKEVLTVQNKSKANKESIFKKAFSFSRGGVKD